MPGRQKAILVSSFLLVIHKIMIGLSTFIKHLLRDSSDNTGMTTLRDVRSL